MSKLLVFFSLYFFILSQKSVLITRKISDNAHSRFEQELIQHIIDIYNIKYNLSLKITNRDMTTINELFDLPIENTMQLSIFGWTITEERQKKFQFTKPYLYCPNVILKLKGNEVLTNKIGIIESSSHHIYKDQLTKYEIKSFNTFADQMSAFEKNEISYIIYDYILVWAKPDTYEVVKLIKQNKYDQYGIIFPKKSKYFKRFSSVFNYYIDSVKFLKLLRKHFGEKAVYFYNRSRS